MSDKVKEFMQRLQTNGNSIPQSERRLDYVDCFVFKSAICQSCGSLITFIDDLIICRTVNELLNRAELEHGKGFEKTNCVSTRLLVVYDAAFVSTSLLKSMEA